MSVVLETHVNRGKYSNEVNSLHLAQQEQPMRYVKDLETYIANEYSLMIHGVSTHFASRRITIKKGSTDALIINIRNL